MRPFVKTSFLFLVALALQVSFFPIIGWPGGGTIPLVSILVVGLGFRRMAQWAVAAGFVFGVVLDILWGLPLGFSSLTLMVMGILSSWLARRVDMEAMLLRYAALCGFLVLENELRSLLAWVAFGQFAAFSFSSMFAALIASPFVFFALRRALSNPPARPVGRRFAAGGSPATSRI